VPCYALLWQCGGESIVRSPQIRRVLYQYPLVSSDDEKIVHLSWENDYVRISGNGGGRWYNFFIHGSAHQDSDSYRHLSVRGTRNPLAFYHLHAQHAQSTAQLEIFDSRNVDIFGVKSESETQILQVKRSAGVRVVGHAGWASALPGFGLYEFEDCQDFLFACFGGFIRDRDGREYSWRKHRSTPFTQYLPLVEKREGAEDIEMTPYQRPLFYERGAF